MALTQSDLLDLAERYIAGTALGMLSLPRELNPVMVRGQGALVWDADGREYIDYLLGSGPLILGHAHPAVVQAVRQQAERGSTFFALNEPIVRLAELMVESVPCGRQSFGDNSGIRFQTTGSEATASACRLARAYTSRDLILKFEGGWHGGSDEGQLSGAPPRLVEFPEAVPDCDGIPIGTRQDVLIAPFNDLPRTEEIANAHRERIAAILVEPLQRFIRPEPGFLRGLRDLADRIGGVLIFDEIVTGFRLAWGGAQEKYGVVPDLACYGKAMSGGYPLSAVCGRKDILNCADASRKGSSPYAFLSGTLAGNPIAAAAGLATLQELNQPGVHERLHDLGERFSDGMAALGRKLGIPLRVEGDGPVRQVMFEREADQLAQPIRNYREGLRCDRQRAVRFGREMIRHGVWCMPGGKTYLSTAHGSDELEKTFQMVAEILPK